MSTHSASAFNDYRAVGMRGWSHLRDALAVTGDIIASIPRAAHAAAVYQQLSVLSDDSLAKRGLKREELPNYVFQSVLNRRA